MRVHFLTKTYGKIMSNPEENSKTNGETTQIVRLASLRTPRDLSLGGVKPNKKIFTPNLNVTRNKSKGSASLNYLDSKKRDDKNKRDRKNDKNKNFKNGPNIIKSGGVFSEGIGAGQRTSQSRNNYGNSTESAAIHRKPTIKSDANVKVDKESEDRKIKIALGGDGLMEEEESVNFSKIRDLDAPIKIPMGDGGWIPKIKVKKEIDLIVKKEPGVEDVEAPPPHRPFVEVKNEPLEDTDLVNLLKRDKPTIIMVQFPMTLPGQGSSADDDRPRKNQDQEPHDNQTKKESRCRLSQLVEGRIGKLQIHRSGRVTLALGDTVLEVSIGTSSAFHEEVVSVSADDGSRSASIVSMSPLVHKMIVYPDWENMLKDLV